MVVGELWVTSVTWAGFGHGASVGGAAWVVKLGLGFYGKRLTERGGVG